MTDNYLDARDNVVLNNIYLDATSILSPYIILPSAYNVQWHRDTVCKYKIQQFDFNIFFFNNTRVDSKDFVFIIYSQSMHIHS